jgi:aspartokinase-like uncharacterized kinase
MMWVVKLGGSLLGSPELARWLDTLVQISDGKVLIVPGGGMFADAVRQAQDTSLINDAVAHHLALLAMDQFGLLLAGMNPGLVTASSELEIAERGWQHRGIVWLPSRMVLADENIPKNWHVTSDSLSAWVANKIGSEHLVLVKSKDLTAYTKASPIAMQTLIDDELIDNAFTEFGAKSNAQIWMLNKADYNVFTQGLNLGKLKEQALTVSKV